jgi:hypothetical protein
MKIITMDMAVARITSVNIAAGQRGFLKAEIFATSSCT